MRKMMKARKAISPVISTLLLIIIAVAAGIVAYGYVTGWLGGAAKSASVAYGELSLDSASASGSTITAYVRNIGGKPVTLAYAYVDGGNQTALSGTINVNEVATLSISPSGFSATAGVIYEVKIVCTDGTSLVFTVKAT